MLPGRLLTADANSVSNANGTINRQDQLATNVAAVVTQVLPNGNLVIEGKQEIRLNSEMRELLVAGIARPEDIDSDNTIELPKIAEARVAYGGKGTLPPTIQQPNIDTASRRHRRCCHFPVPQAPRGSATPVANADPDTAAAGVALSARRPLFWSWTVMHHACRGHDGTSQ